MAVTEKPELYPSRLFLRKQFDRQLKQTAFEGTGSRFSLLAEKVDLYTYLRENFIIKVFFCKKNTCSKVKIILLVYYLCITKNNVLYTLTNKYLMKTVSKITAYYNDAYYRVVLDLNLASSGKLKTIRKEVRKNLHPHLVKILSFELSNREQELLAYLYNAKDQVEAKVHCIKENQVYQCLNTANDPAEVELTTRYNLIKAETEEVFINHTIEEFVEGAHIYIYQ